MPSTSPDTPSALPLPPRRRAALANSGASLLASLHQATQGGHRAFDTLLALEAGFELETYRQVVLGFAAFVPSWEHEISDVLSPAWHGWFGDQRRTPLIERDVVALALGMPAPVPGLERLKLVSPAAALGSLYVLEVQALAGQLVARQAREQHGLGSHNGAAFMTGWGEATAMRWREFRQRIEREVQEPAAVLQACAAAHLTADTLARALRIAQRQGAALAPSPLAGLR